MGNESVQHKEILHRASVSINPDANTMFWEFDLITNTMTTATSGQGIFLGFDDKLWCSSPTFWSDRIHPDERANIIDNCHELANIAPNYELSYRMINKDGAEVWIRDIVEVNTENGKPVSLRGIFIDESESFLTELKLSESERRYRNLLEATSDGIFEIDTLGRLHSISPDIAAKLGYKPLDIEYTPFTDLVDERDRHLVDKQLDDHRLGRSSKYELRFRTKRGDKIWASLAANPIFDSRHERVIGALCTMNDITEKVLAEQRLNANKEGLEEAQRMAKMGSWEEDIKNGQTFWSDEMYRLFELDPNSKLGSSETYLAHVHPEDKKEVTAAYAEMLKGELPITISHRLLISGAIKYVRFNGQTLFNKKNQPIRTVATLQDISESRAASVEIELQREQLELITNNINEVVYSVLFDTDGGSNIRYISDQVELVFGFTPEEYKENLQDIRQFYHPDDVDIIMSLINKVKTDRKAITATYRFKHYKTEQFVWIEESIVPQFDSTGKHIGNFGTARDISQRLQSELLQTVSYNISKVANRRITDLTSLSQAIHLELCKVIDTKNFYIALHMEAENKIFFPFYTDEKDATQHKEIRDFGSGLTEYVMRSKKPLFVKKKDILSLIDQGEVSQIGHNSKVYIGVPLKTEGKTIGVLAVQSYSNPDAYAEKDLELLKFVSRQVAAVIEKHQAQEQLAKSEEYFRSITENASDLITILNEKGVIQYESQSHERVLGYHPQELVGNNVFDYLHPEDRFKIMRFLIKHTKNLASSSTITYRFKHKNGQYRSLESSAKNLLLAPTVKGFVINSRDITPRVLTQQKLENINKELEMFIYKASHDLKGPLASIIGLSNVAVDAIKDPEANQYLEMILKSTSRLDSILNDLLRISKTTQGNVHKRNIEVEPLISEIINSLRHAEHATGIKFTHNIEPGLTIHTDREILSSILQNIIDNAVKYRRIGDDSFVEIVVLEKQNQIMFQIRDNGKGIDYDLQSKVFDMFFRATESSKGTGLGLYMVKKSVEKLGGTINLRSIPNEGSSFRVNIPT